MAYITEISILKRKILTSICKLLFDGNLKEEVRNIAEKIVPDNSTPFKCCIHHDRAITNDRIKVILGLDLDIYKNKSWADCVNAALKNEKSDVSVISVMPEACNGCPQKRYYITEACQHCLAHPCALNYPKDAISILKDKAAIDEDKCVECGKCTQVCPFNAIIKVNRPCEHACPTGAISTDENGIAVIDYEKCIYCGKCMISCPFGAIVEKRDVLYVIKNIIENENLVALIAPSIVAQFSPTATMKQLVTALKKLGFKKVYELAYFADEVAKQEAEEVKENISNNKMTATSCCPAWVNYGKKVNKKFEDNISHTPSPMIKAGEAKKNNEKFVFIGPCISKKKEAEKTEIDFVLTYEELACMLAAKSIDVLSLEETNFDLEGNNKGRIFAQSGGVAEAVQSYLTDKLNVEKINGITKQTKKLFYTIDKEKIDLLEVMSCERGCIGGPCVITNPLVTSKMLEKYIKQNIQ